MKKWSEEIITQLKEINGRISQNSVLGPVLYLLYITCFPVNLDSIIANYENNMAVLVDHNNHIKTSLRLQESLSYI